MSWHSKKNCRYLTSQARAEPNGSKVGESFVEKKEFGVLWFSFWIGSSEEDIVGRPGRAYRTVVGDAAQAESILHRDSNFAAARESGWLVYHPSRFPQGCGSAGQAESNSLFRHHSFCLNEMVFEN